MLRLSLNLLPQGDHRSPRDLGVLEIANIGGTPERGDYAVTLRGPAHADATLRGIPRDQGHWALVRAAVEALFPGENPDARLARLKALPLDQLTPTEQAELFRGIAAELLAERDAYCGRCGVRLREDAAPSART